MINFLWVLWYMFACLSIIGVLVAAFVWTLCKVCDVVTGGWRPWWHKLFFSVLFIGTLSVLFTVILFFLRGLV